MQYECIRDLIDSIKAAHDPDQFRAAMNDAVLALGFDLWCVVQRSRDEIGWNQIQYTNYPRDWLETLAKDYFYLHDPVLKSVCKLMHEFWWDELANTVSLTPKQRAYMGMAADIGLVNGLTIPIHIPGEPMALCSFAVSHRGAKPHGVEPLASYIAQWGVNQARLIRDSIEKKSSGLSKFERDILRMTALGQRPGAIAVTLNVRRETIVRAISELQRRNKAVSPMQVIVRCVHNGELTTHELMN